jgi:hypothetical protein
MSVDSLLTVSRSTKAAYTASACAHNYRPQRDNVSHNSSRHGTESDMNMT